MPTYTYDHIHLRSLEPMETAQYFQKMFDAKIMESVQSDGQPRVDIDVNGLIIFIAKAGKDTPPSLKDPHLGLDHFGFRVDDLDEACKKLEAAKGKAITTRGEGRVHGEGQAAMAPGAPRNFEMKWSGPDDVVIDISHTGWAISK